MMHHVSRGNGEVGADHLAEVNTAAQDESSGAREQKQAKLPVEARTCAPRVAFVLSGGGALGSVQAGQLLALLEAGIVPDLLVGVSIGAFNAGVMAKGATVESAHQLIDLWETFDKSAVMSAKKHQQALRVALGKPYIEISTKLENIIDSHCHPGDISTTPIPLMVTTTDLTNGVQRIWSNGPTNKVIRASVSLPGVFKPVILENCVHVDGGVLSTLPTQVAVDAGAITTINLDIGAGTPFQSIQNMTALSVLTSSFALARRHLTAHDATFGEHQRAFTMPAASTEGIHFWDATQSHRLINESHDLVAEYLEENKLNGDTIYDYTERVLAADSDATTEAQRRSLRTPFGRRRQRQRKMHSPSLPRMAHSGTDPHKHH